MVSYSYAINAQNIAYIHAGTLELGGWQGGRLPPIPFAKGGRGRGQKVPLDFHRAFFSDFPLLIQ